MLPLLVTERSVHTPAHAAISRLCWLCRCILGDPETKIATGGFRTGTEVDGQAPGEPLGSAVAGSDAGWLGGVCRAAREPSAAGFILSAKLIFSGSLRHILTSDGLSSAAMGTACSSCRTVRLLSVASNELPVKHCGKSPTSSAASAAQQQVVLACPCSPCFATGPSEQKCCQVLALSPRRKALFSGPRRAARGPPRGKRRITIPCLTICPVRRQRAAGSWVTSGN